MVAGENRFAPELNEKKVIELLEDLCNILEGRGIFNETIIIPLALVEYEMIIANSALLTSLAIYHLISTACSWNNCQI